MKKPAKSTSSKALSSRSDPAAVAVSQDKVRAEIAKLTLEIDELRSRREREASFHEKLKRWAGTLSTGVALIAAALGVVISVHRWLDEQQQARLQREKEYSLKLGREMIELTNQLSTAETSRREDAALLLSSFETDAIPILLKALGRNHEDVDERILESFVLIGRKSRITDVSTQIVSPFLQQARRELASECAQQAAGERFSWFTEGIRRFATELNAREPAEKALRELRNQAEKCKLPKPDAVVILGHIDKALTGLGE